MMRRRAVLVQRFAMLLRSVPLVSLPAVYRVSNRQSLHQSIATDLGHDACTGNRVHRSIPTHHSRLPLEAEFRHRQPIHQDVLWREGEPAQRPLHRNGGRFADVETVHLRCRGSADPHCFGCLHDLRRELVALRGGEPLRIVGPAPAAAGREYHRRGDHRPGQRSTTHFVQTGDPLKAATPEFLLVIERTLESHLAPRRTLLRRGPGSRLCHRP